MRWLREWWQGWVQTRHPQSSQRIVLRQNRVYIFLSRAGFVFCILLLAMLAGAMNYDLALAYLLVFLLTAMILVSVLHTFRNLLGLALQPGPAEACFVGGHARFDVMLENPSTLSRCNLRVHYGDTMTALDVPPREVRQATLALLATQRGWLRAPRLMIDTDWPLGVFRSWSYAHFAQQALIYPQPEADPPALPGAAVGVGVGVQTPHGHDDFAGLRPFAAGDSPRHVAWKAAARDDTLMVKAFHGEASRMLWLSWDELPSHLDTEARLSRLCAWVLRAHAEHLSYGLALPQHVLAPESGEAHRDQCLAALALFGHREPSA